MPHGALLDNDVQDIYDKIRIRHIGAIATDCLNKHFSIVHNDSP
jgi:hypothetical protein